MLVSIEQIDTAFQLWLSDLAKKWDWTPQFTADHLDDDYGEIHNRETWHPELASLLRRKDWTIAKFKDIASQCFTLNGRYVSIRLNQMLEREEEHGKRLKISLSHFHKTRQRLFNA